MADVILVAGLGYGDEGKGSVIDYLSRLYGPTTETIVVRYNGGAQAAHNVVEPGGRHHTFAQFGSGTLVPGVRTHLSRHMLVNPLFLLSEEEHLQEVGITDGFDRMTIERGALITNPFQVSANRLREMARNKGRHGSCGMGIGETVADFVKNGEEATLRIKDLEDPVTLKAKLLASQRYKAQQMLATYEALPKEDHVEQEWRILIDGTLTDHLVERFTWLAEQVKLVSRWWLHDTLRQPDPTTVLFEGAQGVLLDQDFGTFPYVTRSKITFENAFDLLGDFTGDVRRLGLIRSYMTRHGAGPFVTEDKALAHPEVHNCDGLWQQGWRQGHFDFVALDYALGAIGGVDEMVVTHMDYIDGPQRACTGYDIDWPLPVAQDEPGRLRELQATTTALSGATPTYETFTEAELLARIEGVADAPVTLISRGPTAKDKEDAGHLIPTQDRHSHGPGGQAQVHHPGSAPPERAV